MSPEEKGGLLEQYVDAGRDVAGLDFSGACLQDAALADGKLQGCILVEADLSGATLCAADFHAADLRRAIVVGADLQACILAEANLAGANFEESTLDYARMEGCDLTGATLAGASLKLAYLGGACLRDVNIESACLEGAEIDAATFERSRWSARELARWREAGVQINGLDEFPPDCAAIILGLRRGLLMEFSQPLGLKRIALEALIHKILGPGTDVTIADYHEDMAGTIIRLNGWHAEDLEALGDAFMNRTWRSQREPSFEIGFLRTEALHDVLDQLQRMVKSIELRMPSDEARGMLEAQAEARRALKVVRTWAPSDNPRTALDNLLAMLEPDELRLLLARGPQGAEVVALVPAGAVAPLVLAGQATDALERRGLLDEGFFARLVAARPDLEEQALRVAGIWQSRTR